MPINCYTSLILKISAFFLEGHVTTLSLGRMWETFRSIGIEYHICNTEKSLKKKKLIRVLNLRNTDVTVWTTALNFFFKWSKKAVHLYFFSVLETLMRCILDQCVHVTCWVELGPDGYLSSCSFWQMALLCCLLRKLWKIPERVKDFNCYSPPECFSSVCMPHINSSASKFPGNLISTYRMIKGWVWITIFFPGSQVSPAAHYSEAFSH